MILVDDRQGSAELAPLLSSPSVVCRLPFADFSWSGYGPGGPVYVGVERKVILDLLQSMVSGRLSGHQLIGLTREYDRVYLLVEGIWRPDRRNGMMVSPSGGTWKPVALGSRRFMAREIWSFLQSLSVICGILVVTTSNRHESAMWLDAAFGWWSKPWKKHKSHLAFQQPVAHAQLTRPSLATRIWSQFDGVGWEKARALGKAFPLPEDITFSTREDLESVPGVGPKLAESIIRQRNEEESK